MESQNRRVAVLTGERVVLSHVLRSDVPQFARWFADLELTAYLGQNGMSVRYEQEEQWFNRLAESDDRLFAIVVRESDSVIGTVTLSAISQVHGIAELGIAIGDKRAWGQGYGSEAARLMVEYGFVFLNLHTIYLWHVAFNQRGHRAYLRAGFRVAGVLRGATQFNGQRYDRILMDITRSDVPPSQLPRMLDQLAADDHHPAE
jgi:RimJ/RimL family protein N-acetyltransferase